MAADETQEAKPDDSVAREDVAAYIRHELAPLIPAHSSEIDHLVDAADGCFEWAVMACRYILGREGEEKAVPIDRRFELVVSCPSDLNVLCQLIMEQIYRAPTASDLTHIDFIYALVSGAPLPWADTYLLQFLAQDIFPPSIDHTSFARTVDRLYPLIYRSRETRVCFVPFQVSLPSLFRSRKHADIDADDTSSHKLWTQVWKDRVLTLTCCNVMKHTLHFNMCQVPISFTPQAKIPGFDAQIKSAIMPETLYACRRWAYHAASVNQDDDEVVEKLVEVLSTKALPWLEVLSLSGVSPEKVLENFAIWKVNTNSVTYTTTD